MTELIKLINNVTMLFSVFVLGVLCVSLYTKLALKKIETQSFLALSVSIGFVIKYIVDYIDTFLSKAHIGLNGFPIVVVYSVVGILSAIVYFKLKNCVWVRWKASKHFGVDTADNIWTRHIDAEGQTNVLLYLDDGTYILGRIDTVDDEYITLSHHSSATTPDGKDMDEASRHPISTVMCVPMCHVKRFEFLYDNKNSHLARWCLR